MSVQISTKPSTGSATTFNSEIRLYGYAGQGSTNTTVDRFSTIAVNTGTNLTLTQSATNGDSVTVAVGGGGIYSIMAMRGKDAGSTAIVGITVNSASLTTSIASIPNTTRVAYQSLDGATGSQSAATCTVTLRLADGDVVRQQSEASAVSTTANCIFHIVQVGR